MNEKLKNLNKKQFEKCLITLEMLTFETPKIYTGRAPYCHFYCKKYYFAFRIVALVVNSKFVKNEIPYQLPKFSGKRK